MSDDKPSNMDVKKPPYNYAAHFAQVRNMGELVRDPHEQTWTSNILAAPEHHQYVVWLGCNVIRTAHIAESLSDILHHVGVDFVALGGPTYCCGAIHQTHGAKQIGDNMLRQTMKKFDTFTPEHMLNWCPSCDTQLRKISNDQLTDTAKGRKTVTTFLEKVLRSDLFRIAVPVKVAIHSHGGTPDEDADRIAARAILSRIPELEVVELPPVVKIPRHCSESSIRKFGEEAYKAELEGWLQDARAAGADKIVSIYHSCHRQLLLLQRSAAENRIEVVNYLSIIAQSLGLKEREDKFDLLSRRESVDDMLSAVSANIETLGLDQEKARKTLTKQFKR